MEEPRSKTKRGPEPKSADELRPLMNQKPANQSVPLRYYSTSKLQWNNMAGGPIKSSLSASEKVSSEDERKLKPAPANQPHFRPGHPAPFSSTPTCPISAQANLRHSTPPVTTADIERKEAFELIKQGRELVKNWKLPSPATLQQYIGAMDLLRQNEQWPEEYAQSKKGFYFYRAAMIACTLSSIHDELTIIDRLQKKTDPAWVAKAKALSRQLGILKRYPPDQKKLHLGASILGKWQATGKAPRSNSKRPGLGGLPQNWCSCFWKSFPEDSSYRLPLAILISTGCRPSELVKGVRVERDESGDLLFCIQGSKTHGGKYGQQYRQITIAADSEEASFLLRSAEANQGTMTVFVKNAKALTESIRRHSKKIWPRRKYIVSPYSFRHQFSADLKNEYEPDEIAMALGHCVCKTQQYYGVRQQGRAGRKLIMVQAEKIPRQNQGQSFHDKRDNGNWSDFQPQ